jgi:hypothetical protein
MDSDLPDTLHLSLPDAVTVGMEMMNMSIINLAKPNERQSLWSLFLGIAIWFLHMNLFNALISLSCKWGWLTFAIGDLSGLQFLEAMISLITILVMLLLIYLPWRYWRSFQTEKPRDNPQLLRDTEEDRRPLMAFIATLLNGFFFLFVIGTFVAIFALKSCGQA